jgi:hypothetical protein
VEAAEADRRSVDHHQPQADAVAFEELVASLDGLDRPWSRQHLAVEQITAHVSIEAQRVKRVGVFGGEPAIAEARGARAHLASDQEGEKRSAS